MTAGHTLSPVQRAIREHVLALNMGRCCLCNRQATNFAHRLPEGQGGPFIIPNGLPMDGSGTTGCHWRTEQRRELSYRCGWLIRADTDPAGRNARIAATPALVRTQLGTGWHLLDWLGEDGRPVGMPRLAEPGEVPAGMWPGTYEAAVRQLHQRPGP